MQEKGRRLTAPAEVALRAHLVARHRPPVSSRLRPWPGPTPFFRGYPFFISSMVPFSSISAASASFLLCMTGVITSRSIASEASGKTGDW